MSGPPKRNKSLRVEWAMILPEKRIKKKEREPLKPEPTPYACKWCHRRFAESKKVAAHIFNSHKYFFVKDDTYELSARQGYYTGRLGIH